jgi:hypothetical protein
MSKRSSGLFFLATFLTAGQAFAQSSLFYLEAQGIAGYSSAQDKWVFYSMHPDQAMQKSSLGFDYLQRFSRETGDFAVLAIQARLAWDGEGHKAVEPQLYNAYLKFKFPAVDLWFGHNRPAFGLSSVFDNHALILPTLVMNGFGFDRDWGVGLSRDTVRGNWGVSLTAGSGMPLRFQGNYLLSGRLSFGVLSSDNWSIGLSTSYGKALETIGYEVNSSDPLPFRLVGVDITSLWNNLESRLEAVAGQKSGKNTRSVFWRLGVNLLEESRLKWEAQPVVVREGGKTRLQLGTGLSFLATADLTLRTMVTYDRKERDSRVIFQVYYYKRILF